MCRVYYIALIFLFAIGFSFGQIAEAEFGKNRVQYTKDFEYWWEYETDHFYTYWYGKGKKSAIAAMQMAEHDFLEIQRLLEFKVEEKLEIIVFKDIGDLLQTNIGIEDDFLFNPTSAYVLGNKILVYFDGSYFNLRKDIRKGISAVMVNQMMTAANLQEVVKSALKSQIPDWFSKGIISFAADSWNVSQEEVMRNFFNTRSGRKEFKDLSKANPEVAGHAFWFYIRNQYGASTISNLLYLMRISRDVDRSFHFVLGMDKKMILKECIDYFRMIYNNDQDGFAYLETKNKNLPRKLKKDKLVRTQWASDTSYQLLVTNHFGKKKVYLLNPKNADRNLLFKTGTGHPSYFESDDYPLTRFSPDGKITLIYDEKDKLKYAIIDPVTGEVFTDRINPLFQQVFSFDFIREDKWVMSASFDGYSDLFYYWPGKAQYERITEDCWNDLDVKVIHGSGDTSILFTSSRPELTLEKQELDTFFPGTALDIFELNPEDKSLKRITNTPEESERHPLKSDDDNYYFLTDINGIQQIGNITKGGNNIKHTPYDLNIESFDLEEDRISFTFDRCQFPGLAIMNNYTAGRGISWYKEKEIKDVEEAEEISDEEENPILFQSRFDDIKRTGEPEQKNQLVSKEGELPSRVLKYVSTKAYASRLRFKVHSVESYLDRNPLFTELNSYTADGQGYVNPDFGLLNKFVLLDLFQDYRLEAGLRIPTNLSGVEWFAVADNYKRRWDKRVAFYAKMRKTSEYDIVDGLRVMKYQTYIAANTWTYPIDVFKSVKLTGLLRQDIHTPLSTTLGTLEESPEKFQRIGLRTEFVIDNSYEKNYNIYTGLRAKVFAEVMNRFQVQFNPAEFSASEGFMGTVGLDARYYQELDLHSILALRLAGSASFGNERTVFGMGGMENWLIPSQESQPLPAGLNYAYFGPAFQMRGFKQGARQGTSYLLANAELRIPIFHYLTKNYIRSAFLRNFQITGFFDIGSSWFGWSPYSSDNPLNSIILDDSDYVIVEVNYFKEPFIFGFGPGVRTTFLGYFIKLDMGWGWETGSLKNPMLYLSMGKDF
jgi:hypothetical protein